MSTQLFFGSNSNGLVSGWGNGQNMAKLDGTASGWLLNGVVIARGPTATAFSMNTVTGPTNGIETADSITGLPFHWATEPLDRDITISGTITFNIWGSESSMAANAGVQVVVERIDSQGNVVSTVCNKEFGTEFGTSNSANNFTATPTSTAFLKGDRIRIRIAGNDAGGTMVSGSAFTIVVASPTGGISGDSFITFTETFGFLTTTPAGTTLFLGDTAASGGIAPGTATAKDATLTRGAGVVTSVTNTAAGWTAPIQVTHTAGGTAIEWYSRPLNAFTLAGLIAANVWMQMSGASSGTALKAEVAVTANDGTGATIWASQELNAGVGTGDLVIVPLWLSGEDVTVSLGQRLRFKLSIDDNDDVPMVTGRTATIRYAGVTGGVTGDSFFTLTQTVTEQVAATSLVFEPRRVSRNSNLRRCVGRVFKKKPLGVFIPDRDILLPV